MNKCEKVERGSGNVFADLGLPDAEERLAKAQIAHTIAETIRSWHHGRHRATSSTRAQQVLTELTPIILKAFGETSEPDAAFNRAARMSRSLDSYNRIYSRSAVLGVLDQ